MKLKIGQIAKQSGVPASTIRYYVAEGLLPKPEKANEKMAYYDETCIERLRIIQDLKERRYFPLYLIKNILRRMDEGLTLPEAEDVENAVFGMDTHIGAGLFDRKAFLKATGLTEKDIKKAETLNILIPFAAGDGRPLYNEEDIRVGRDGIKKMLGLGIELADLSFWVELGRLIVDHEMDLRRKIVSGHTTRDNIRLTTELTKISDFYRVYILRRLFQRQVEQNIRESLRKKKKTPASLKRRKTSLGDDYV